jgi:hypothetical protein
METRRAVYGQFDYIPCISCAHSPSSCTPQSDIITLNDTELTHVWRKLTEAQKKGFICEDLITHPCHIQAGESAVLFFSSVDFV